MIHRPGRENIADALSRLLHRKVEPDNHQRCTEEYVRFVAVSATPTALTTREKEEASADDEQLKEVRKAIATGSLKSVDNIREWRGSCVSLVSSCLEVHALLFYRKLQPRTLALAHEGHLGVVGTKQNRRTKVWWPGMDKAAERHCRACHGCQLVERPDPAEPIRSTSLPDGPW